METLVNNAEFQTIDDISFKEVSEGDGKYEDAIQIYSNTNQALEEQAYESLKEKNWALQEYWQKKGAPTEEILIKNSNGLSLNLYNFGKELSSQQEKEIIDAINKMAYLVPKEEQSKVRYILIDNEQATNPNDNSAQNGASASKTNSIILYPQALKNISHRVEGVSNLTGTVIHELSHGYLEKLILEAWKKEFEWKHSDVDIILPSGNMQFETTSHPENCVTEYAKYSPKEDIVESMVAALENPDLLDSKRLEFITKQIIGNKKPETTIPTEKLTGKNITLPRITDDVFYKVKEQFKMKFKIIETTDKKTKQIIDNPGL
jgi:hypothetical protein